MHLVFVIYFFVFSFLTFKGSSEILNLRLYMPPIAQENSSVTMECMFDLENSPIYTVQWYFRNNEIFRFIPKENPPIKIFYRPGLHVDKSASNAHRLTLLNVTKSVSGEYSCEVTTEGPNFKTKCVVSNLTVVDVRLSIEITKTKFKFAEIINATCNVQSDFPSTKLFFLLDNILIPDAYVYQGYNSIQLTVNSSLYSIPNSKTVARLRCSALLNNTYYVTSQPTMVVLLPGKDKSKSSEIYLDFLLHFISIILLILHLK